MKIEELYISGFGALCEYSCEFNDGVNIISKENEWGKTTLAEFIRAMLYGLNSGVRSIRENPRKKYMPWGKTTMGGELTVSHEGRSYIIVRSFGLRKGDDTVNVIDNISGQKIEQYCTDTPGFEITGVGEEAFSKALYLNHLSVDMDGKNGEIIDRLVGLIKSGDESFSYKKGVRLLDSAISEIESPRSGKIKVLKNTLEDYYSALNEEKKRADNVVSLREKIKRLKEQEEQLRNTKIDKSLWVITYVLAIIDLLLIFVSLWAFIGVLAGTVAFVLIRLRNAQANNVSTRLEISRKIGECETLLKEQMQGEIDSAEEKINLVNEKIFIYEQKVQKLKLAKKCLDMAFSKIQQGFGTKLNAYVSEILAVITSGKYDGVKVDENFEMTVHCKDGWQSAQYLSDGAYSQIYFSLKMSIAKMLFPDMPIIIDDAFLLYDEKRFKKAMEYLNNCETQVIALGVSK